MTPPMKLLATITILLFLLIPCALASDYTIQVNESFMNYSLRSANVTIGGVSNLTDSLGLATIYGLGSSENYTVEMRGYAAKSGTMTPGEKQVLLTPSSTGNVIMSFIPYFTDSFDRPDNLTVDNGWTQSESEGNVTITDNRLNFSTWRDSANVKLYRTIDYSQFNYIAFTIERQTVNPSNAGIANYFRSGGIAGPVVTFQDYISNNDVRAYVGSPGNYEIIGNITGFTPHLIEYYFNKTTNNTMDLYIDGVFNQTTYVSDVGYYFNMIDTLIMQFGSAAAHTDLFDNVLFGNVEPYVCTPSWSCTGYSSTCIAGGQACNTVVDANVCGSNYSGNFSEFTPLSCSETNYVLTAPANGSTQLTNVLFNLTISSNSSLPMNCDFKIDGAHNSTDTVAASPTTLTFARTLADGSYSWRENCSDTTSSATHIFTVCTPSWACSAFGACAPNNVSVCNAVVDANVCGFSFTGNLSAYNNNSCGYVPCVANWTCSGYGACQENLTQTCNAVTDENTCGYTYGGNYSEFSAQGCTPPPSQSALAMSTLIALLTILIFLYMADSLLPTKSPEAKELFRYAYILLGIIGLIAVVGMLFGV